MASTPVRGNSDGYSRWTVPRKDDPLTPHIEKVERHLESLNLVCMPEIIHRAAYLQSLPHLSGAAQDGRLNQAAFIEMALAGLRAEQAHGLVGELEEYLSHHGGDPNYYHLRRRSGDLKSEEFQNSLQDILDQVFSTFSCLDIY